MSVILLRVRGGLDFSAHIVDEELVEPEVMTVFSKIEKLNKDMQFNLYSPEYLGLHN